MAWNGSGVYSRTNGTHTGSTAWEQDRVAGDYIIATRHDTHDEDIATAINACLTKNNESKPTSTFAPNADGTLDLGTTSLRWRYIYANGLTYNSTGLGVGVSPSFLVHVGANAAGAQQVIDSGASSSNLTLRRANTSLTAPSALAANDLIGVVAWQGYHSGGAYVTARARVEGYAGENWTNTAQGTYIAFSVTPNTTTAMAERLRLTGDGRLYGTALHNNAGAITGATNQYIASGTYTPTATATLNVTGTTVYGDTMFTRVGNVVTVAGELVLDPTATGLIDFRITLPVASALTQTYQLGGTAVNAVGVAFAISGDATNDAARFIGTAAADTSQSLWFTFTYTVL